MKRFPFVVVLLVGLVLSGGPARADFIATATLTGDGESNSTGHGFGTLTFSTALDALSYSLSFAELTSPTEVAPRSPGGRLHPFW
jgi:hypothetical protein